MAGLWQANRPKLVIETAVAFQEGARARAQARATQRKNARALGFDYKLCGDRLNRHTQSFDSVHNTTMKFLVSFISDLSSIEQN